MKKIAVLFSGKGSNFAHIVKTLHRKEFEVVVALTNNPDAKGIEVAKAASIPLEIIDSKAYKSREAFDAAVVKCLQRYNADLTVLAGFMRILTPVFTDRLKVSTFIPLYSQDTKVLKPLKKVMKISFTNGGVSIHYVTSELDGGEIILQKEISKAGLNFETYDEKIRNFGKRGIGRSYQSGTKLNFYGISTRILCTFFC